MEGLERDKDRNQKHQSWEYSLCLWVSAQCSLLGKKKAGMRGKNIISKSLADTVCLRLKTEQSQSQTSPQELFLRLFLLTRQTSQAEKRDVCFVLGGGQWEQQHCHPGEPWCHPLPALPSPPGTGGRDSLAEGLAQLGRSSRQPGKGWTAVGG